MKEMIKNRIRESIAVKNAIAEDIDLLKRIENAANIIIDAYKSGNRFLLCGNGGSAADAQHIAAELSGRYLIDRPPLDAEALSVNTSYITAVSNDYGYNEIFSRLLEAQGKEGDVLLAISTSGNSSNILMAIDTAKDKKMSIIALTGASGGKMKDKADILLNVPSTDTPRIQESHILIGHVICELIESKLFSSGNK
ncbi:MAG: D-sedoheptulose 7-phosphate isomerase [Bacteroidales bacterium]|nr:D-sedoheptulose 7-phosphate isomerase [Bacteroidales bacterium]